MRAAFSTQTHIGHELTERSELGSSSGHEDCHRDCLAGGAPPPEFRKPQELAEPVGDDGLEVRGSWAPSRSSHR
ncbi:hypothetical protein MPTK1_2g01990 [Marchantia polymorpha subsp. ruderalis]|uniref:Uncharacterized protein n=1 Tax=Marchantia polymorpha TaxID=3197 RepID=A0A2R6W867_MARPO|nr:hypothetical protein MARPO_0130s0007 [Marchantia polymorpha]BBN00773.1 hypothetical protein Mp_2g01990 [Marchantia polymorpha subsp. ruderalis]|eukprot:PTQ30050.1 hypothetical protein MARPO_0130s0007 [Marchantia polymorpha]